MKTKKIGIPKSRVLVSTALMVIALGFPSISYSFPVEPGSHGNLLIFSLTNDDPQIPLQATVSPRSVPDYMGHIAPEMVRTLPPIAMPGESAEVFFVFDVDDTASVGRMDDLALEIVRTEGDTIMVIIPLEVVAQQLLANAVEVIFRATFPSPPPPGGGDLVEAMVDDSFPVTLSDNGVLPDITVDDGVWTGSFIFPPLDLQQDIAIYCCSMEFPSVIRHSRATFVSLLWMTGYTTTREIPSSFRRLRTFNATRLRSQPRLLFLQSLRLLTPIRFAMGLI